MVAVLSDLNAYLTLNVRVGAEWDRLSVMVGAVKQDMLARAKTSPV